MAQRKVVNPFKPLLNRLPTGIRNRYWFLLIPFMIWIAFLDKASLWKQYKLSRSVQKLENDKIYYKQKLEEVQQEKKDIDSDKEKFARERYYMKADNEDVFVIEKR